GRLAAASRAAAAPGGRARRLESGARRRRSSYISVPSGPWAPSLRARDRAKWLSSSRRKVTTGGGSGPPCREHWSAERLQTVNSWPASVHLASVPRGAASRRQMVRCIVLLALAVAVAILPAAAGSSAQAPMEEVTFQAGALTLRGFLYKPE